MDKKPEEFCQSSALTIVKQMKNFLVVNMPYSDLTVRVRMLLTHLEEEEATGSEAKNEEASGRCLTPCEVCSVPGVPGGGLKGSSLQELSLYHSLGTCPFVGEGPGFQADMVSSFFFLFF